VLTLLRRIREDRGLPYAARAARRADARGVPAVDPGADRVVAAALAWLARAQDRSITADGGFARDFSLIRGWASSYPETSGYLVPTLLDTDDAQFVERARRCLDWLVAIQFPDGGFQGGKVDQTPRVPVTFNTGQILLGLAAGAARLDRARYLEPMRRAAAFLRDSLDADGCWRSHPTPFAKPGEKAYETHVSWGLFEAARVLPDEGFGEAGLRQVAWALTKQAPNGWFASNCLENPAAPLTHTIGYVLRGVVEAWRWSGDTALLAAAERTASGLLPAIEPDGRLPGRLDRTWRSAVPWVCLTGSAQIVHSLLLIAGPLGRPDFVQAARRLNAYVRRTVALAGDPDIVGGVRGSFPIDGDYGRFEYLNWAAKFLIDSCRAEAKLVGAVEGS